MKTIPILFALLVVLVIACRPTQKTTSDFKISTSDSFKRRAGAEIEGIYIDKFGRTIKLSVDNSRRFEYSCQPLYLNYYEDDLDSTILHLDSSDFYMPCMVVTGVWDYNYDTLADEILLSTNTNSNVSRRYHRTLDGYPAYNGIILRQSNTYRDSFILCVELSQDLPQRGYLSVDISVDMQNVKLMDKEAKIDTFLPYLKSIKQSEKYYSFYFLINDLEYTATHKFRFAVPKFSPSHTLYNITVRYETDYPINFCYIDTANKNNLIDSFYFISQDFEYDLPILNSVQEVDILMYPTHVANWQSLPFRFDMGGNLVGQYPVRPQICLDEDCIKPPFYTTYYKQK